MQKKKKNKAALHQGMQKKKKKRKRSTKDIMLTVAGVLRLRRMATDGKPICEKTGQKRVWTETREQIEAL